MDECNLDYLPTIIQAATNLKKIYLRRNNLQCVHQLYLQQRPGLTVKGLTQKCDNNGDCTL